MKKPFTLLLLLSGVVCVLSGCGGGSKLPEAYSAGEDSLPSLTALVTLDPAPECTAQTQEDNTSYQYTQLEDPAQAVADYQAALETDYECVALSPEGTRLPEDSELSSEGELILARESASGSGLFELSLSWDETSCTVTPSLDEEASLPEESPSMSIDEVENYFRTLSPTSLGLSGTDMSDYNIICENGLVLLDGAPCLCINIYKDDTFQGSYLFSTDTRKVYQLQRSTGTAHPISR